MMRTPGSSLPPFRTFRLALTVALGAWLLLPLGAQTPGRVRVVTTLPVLADLARQVGGREVEVRSLARGPEDPHFVVATPSLMSAVNRANLFVEVGLSLELWAENVLDGARNPRIRRGGPGHVFASVGVPLKEVPGTLTRAEGDLHPEGNPHIWMDPVNLGTMAGNITKGLQRAAPDRRELWEAGLGGFQRRLDMALYGPELPRLLGGGVLNRLARGGRLWLFLSGKTFRGRRLSERVGGWLERAASLRGRTIVFHHQSWVYFADRFGLRIASYVEEKPGIPPSAARKEALIRLMKAQEVRVIAVLNYYDDTVARALARETGARVVVLPGNVGARPGTGDSFKLMDQVIERLVAAFGER